MDAIVTQILQAKKNELDQLKKYLETHLNTLRNNVASINHAISALEPSKHTLGICYMLFAKAQNLPHDAQFIPQCESFLDSYNATQIRDICPDKFAFVVHKYAELLRQITQPQRGIVRLSKVINTFCLSSDYLSPAHSDFVMLCLVSKNYKVARRVIDRTIFEIDPKKMGLTPRDLLLYYYYSSMIWIGLKMWDKAYEFSQTAITVPCSALSAIMVEAFKKFVIASLITRGKMDALPKQCSPIVQRHIKKYAPEYVEFATAYTKREGDKMEELVTKHSEVFLQDHNMGIIDQAMKKYMQQAIQRLTSTYLTLSLSDIAANVRLASPKHAEEILLTMIQSGELAACINQKDGMVSFTDTTNATALMDSVEEEIEATQKIVQRLEAMDEDIQTSREYLTKQILRDPHLRDELEQVIRSGGGKGKVRGILENLLKG